MGESFFRVNSCCCCISIWLGTMIIGCLLFTDLLVELKYPSNIRLIVKLITIASFITMIYRDFAWSRCAFFFIYCFNRSIEIINDVWTIDAIVATLPEDVCTSESNPKDEASRNAIKQEYDECVQYVE